MEEQINQIKLNQEKKLTRLSRRLRKPKVIVIVTILLVAGTVYSGYSYFSSSTKAQEGVEKNQVLAKEVKTVILDLAKDNTDLITTVGTVKAEARIDAVALVSGTIRGLYFQVGDSVLANKYLASLANSSISTSYNNAQINIMNLENNLASTERITDETIRQAELGVQNALESVQAAEIALATTQDNLANAQALKDKSNQDTKESAVISFYDYLNTINNTLDQVNYVIKAEGSIQLDGIATTLGILNGQSITNAKKSYLTARAGYNSLTGLAPASDTITDEMSQIINGLSQAKKAVDDTIIVLDNTISSPDFNEASLNSLKINFTGLRSAVVNAQISAKRILQNLENLGLVNKQELDALANAIKSAQSQIALAQVGYDNAIAALDNVKQAKQQQLIGAQTTLDNAKGQLNLTGTQVADLTIKAPISGKITRKYVELGSEVSPGQKIAEISQTKTVKIEVSLAAEDIYRVKSGQIVNIGDDLVGTISLIDPAADPITRKVRLEIFFDNKDNKLIPGTFIDVAIPVARLEKTHAESVFVPLRTVTITQNENFVFIVVAGKAKKVQVVTGKTAGALIEILDGLHNNDELVVEGNKSLEEGDQVEVK